MNTPATDATVDRVNLAVRLAWATVVLSFIAGIYAWSVGPDPDHALAQLIFGVPLGWFLARMLEKGHNWARLVWGVLSGASGLFGLLVFAVGFGRFGIADTLSILTQTGLSLAIAVLLFRRDVREWFKHPEAQQAQRV
ncbi:MAG: hypothetical protein AAF430_18885 [Myxococcota bacterium]